MKRAGARITGVEPGGIAAELKLEPGDTLVEINRCQLNDLIDYQYLCADQHLEILVVKKNGESWLLEVDKDYDEGLGLEFAQPVFDQVKKCCNRCIFCFVDQLPAGLRPSLYLKDDDYRLSFLQGNFITLTNLTPDDLERIRNLKLSPLYVSVHATDPDVRQSLCRHPDAGRVLDQLKLLTGSGIEIHAQLVLCPGINDGPVLRRSLADLAALWPRLASVGVVPVGLTGHRSKLPPLQAFGREQAARVIEIVDSCHQASVRDFGYGFCFAADEFYLLAGKPFPETGYYEDFPQMENGIGLARRFYDDFQLLEPGLPRALSRPRRVAVATGVDGFRVLEPVLDRLNRIEGLVITPVTVPNRFFGPSVTVTGLVAGQDLLREVQNLPAGTEVLVPAVMLKDGDGCFLDDLTVAGLEQASGVRIVTVAATAGELVRAVLE